MIKNVHLIVMICANDFLHSKQEHLLQNRRGITSSETLTGNFVYFLLNFQIFVLLHVAESCLVHNLVDDMFGELLPEKRRKSLNCRLRKRYRYASSKKCGQAESKCHMEICHSEGLEGSDFHSARQEFNATVICSNTARA